MQPMSRVNQYLKTADECQRELDELIATMPQEEATTEEGKFYREIALSLKERCANDIQRMRQLEEYNNILTENDGEVRRTTHLLERESTNARYWRVFAYFTTTASTAAAALMSIASLVAAVASIALVLRRSS